MSQYDTISVKPSTGALGASVTGVDLSATLMPAQMGEIRRALLEHLVLCFPDQTITPSQQRAFGMRFGPLDVHPYTKPMAEFPEILEIVKDKSDAANFGEGWHTDMTYMETPPLATMLVAREVPPRGGDTLFANMYAAYEALSARMKAMLEGLVCVHGAGSTYGSNDRMSRDAHSTEVLIGKEERQVEHPLVRTHPETGRKCLFVNPGHTYHIKGLNEDESDAILDFLYEHSVRPEFTYRHSWVNNSVVMWDNRCTQHNALNDYHGHRRVMHRVVIRGDVPR